MLAATTIRATTPAAAAATSGANHRRVGAGVNLAGGGGTGDAATRLIVAAMNSSVSMSTSLDPLTLTPEQPPRPGATRRAHGRDVSSPSRPRTRGSRPPPGSGGPPGRSAPPLPAADEAATASRCPAMRPGSADPAPQLQPDRVGRRAAPRVAGDASSCAGL